MTSPWQPIVIEKSERVHAIGRVVVVRMEVDRNDWYLSVMDWQHELGDKRLGIDVVNRRMHARADRELRRAVLEALREFPSVTPEERAEKVAEAKEWAKINKPWLLDAPRLAVR